jgi:hypothetical protein
MAELEPETSGWLAKVTPDREAPRYFIAATATADEAEAIIKNRRRLHGRIEILCKIDIPNVMGFTLRRGEVRQIDYDPPQTP